MRTLQEIQQDIINTCAELGDAIYTIHAQEKRAKESESRIDTLRAELKEAQKEGANGSSDTQQQ